MKVTRADWAGSVPWSGVTGKPTEINSVGSTATDLTALMARVAALEKAVTSLSSRVSKSPVSSFHVEWTISSLEAFQSAYEDLVVAGVQASSACLLVPQDPTPFLQGSAVAIGPSLVRLSVTNLAPTPLTLGLSVWTLVVIDG